MSNVFFTSSEVDVSVWRAIVGTATEIPPINTYIYYFPQGHLEQSSYSDDPINYSFTLLPPWIPCLVLSVNFLANSYSDQAYTKMLLQPVPLPMENDRDVVVNNNNDIISFVKILTRSDVYSSGGLTIPQHCAHILLPPLDQTIDFPNQILVFKDAHNVSWEFQHIFRGTPRRHLLTTGWCKFVRDKRLFDGDSIVLMKKRSTNELFIGIRRAHYNNIDYQQDRSEALAAITALTMGLPFEVTYYPQIKVPIFVVKAEKVVRALSRRWIVGMRVRMAVETNIIPELTWTYGVVSGVMMPNRGMLYDSSWRMLQVNWEDPKTAQHVGRVSPWEVEEYITFLEPRTIPFHTMSSSVFHDPPPFPANIQGARLDRDGTITNLSFANMDNQRPTIGNSYPDILSPTNQSSVQSNGGGDSSTSFQLFGKTIKMSRQ